MYASKRRQRNFKRIRTAPACAAVGDLAKGNLLSAGHCHQQQQQQGGASTATGAAANGRGGTHHQHQPLPSNPSKRHRERLNGELETVASLLPYDEPTIQRLDKLSVLRLAVSFLQIKAHFQVCSQLAQLQPSGRCVDHPFANLRTPIGPVPSLLEPVSRVPSFDCAEPFFGQLAQKALGAFLLILHLDGDIFYVSENIETYLGFQQSDVLHQPLFEMVHSEDREELRTMLQRIQQLGTDEHGEMLATEWNVPIVLRFRCLLDNTCGFIRVELRSRVLAVHSHQSSGLSSFVPPAPPPPPALGRPPAGGHHQNSTDTSGPPKRAMVAVCIPFVPPLQMDALMDDPILKSKHTLSLGIQCMDMRLRQILELDDDGAVGPGTSSFSSATLADSSLYSFVHPADLKYVAESHESVIKYCSSGLMIYRLVSVRSKHVYYMQSSFRLSFKNGKPDSIGANHRVLTEVDGESLLEKRNTLKFKFLSFDDTLLQSPRIFQQPQPSAIAAGSSHSPNPTIGNQQIKPDIAAVMIGCQQKQQQKANSTGNMLLDVTSSSAANHHQKKSHHKKKEAKKDEKGGKDAKKPSGIVAPLIGPYNAEGPIPFGGGGQNANASTASAPILPNGAAAFFAAAQFQSNFLPSSTNSDLNSILHQNPAIEAGPSSIAWPPSAGTNSTQSGGGPPSAGIPGARLKRTQVTFERYYAETVDLTPYYQYYCYPMGGGTPTANLNGSTGNANPLMDFTAMGVANYGAGPQQQTADYWTSMMAAAGIDANAQHFQFPPALPAGTDLMMGGLGQSMFYWPQQGLDLSAALPPFYPPPPTITSTSAPTATTTTGSTTTDGGNSLQQQQQNVPQLCANEATSSSTVGSAAAAAEHFPSHLHYPQHEHPTTELHHLNWPIPSGLSAPAPLSAVHSTPLLASAEVGRTQRRGSLSQMERIQQKLAAKAQTHEEESGNYHQHHHHLADALHQQHFIAPQQHQQQQAHPVPVQTPTLTSAPGSGFRFLSEVAQTLFGQ